MSGSGTQRPSAPMPTPGFIHFYDHHRAHGVLGWATPTSLIQDNLPGCHHESQPILTLLRELSQAPPVRFCLWDTGRFAPNARGKGS